MERTPGKPLAISVIFFGTKINMDYKCPIHLQNWKVIPAGISKKTGKAYHAFKVCPVEGCTEKPVELNKQEPIDNAISQGIQAPQTAQSMVDERSYRIERQHSQEMALRFLDLLVKTEQIHEVTSDLVEVYTKHFMEDLEREE